MAYIEPVTDRSAEDIANKTSKAFWNVEDFERVYGNSLLINGYVSILLEDNIPFTGLSIPTVETIPNADDFNAFLENIENLRETCASEGVAGISMPIKQDYVAGLGSRTPTYEDANLWESTLDAIWVHFGGPDLEVCPTLTSGTTINDGNRWIIVDCLDMEDFNLALDGSAQLIIL